MTVLALILLGQGIICASFFNICQRWVIRERALSISEVLLIQHATSLPLLASALLWWHGWGTTFSRNTTIFWSATILATLCSVIIQLANAKSHKGEASLVAPIRAMTPGMVTVAAFFVHEYPSQQGILGILLIAGGTYLHGIQEKPGRLQAADYLKPFKLLRLPADYQNLAEAQKLKVRNSTHALRWAYLSALFGTIGLVCDGLSARHGNVIVSSLAQAVGLVVAYGLLFPILNKNQEEKLTEPLAQRCKRYWWQILLVGICFGLQAVFFPTVFRLAPIAYAGSIKRLGIVLTVLLAWWILKEKQAKLRLWPASLITLGVILLAGDNSVDSIIKQLEKN